ncbi:hypothetical protein OF83DRAFT_1167865 [Amylostereum chailletii]|nr:hypothetical protein OF83DRAFT_1167865 [Amylostereum chailletii]
MDVDPQEGNVNLAAAYWSDATTPRLNFLDIVASNKNPENASEVVQTIRSEINAVDKAAALVKRRLNAVMPVARLHPEILAIILSHNAVDEPHYDLGKIDSYYHDLRNTLGWIKVSHVSHRWREVALSYPSLWSVVTFTHGFEWAQEFVARSKATPILIDLCADPSRVPGPEVVSVIESQLHRIHTLHLCCPTSIISSLKLCHPAPLLHTFRARSIDLVSNETPPSPLFAGQTPSLRHLDVEHAEVVNWNEPIFSGLTTLLLKTDGRLLPSSGSSIHAVLGALQRMHRLETLVLHIPNIGGADTPLPNTSDANLPCLAYLNVGEMSLQTTAVLLRHIHRPHNTQLSLFCTPDDDTDASLGLQALAHHLQDIPPMREMQSLHVFTTRHNQNQVTHGLRVWREFDVDPVGEMPLVPVESAAHAFRIDLQFSGEEPGGEPLDATDLCTMLPFQNVRALSVDANGMVWDVEAFSNTFRDYPKVEHIHAVVSGTELLGSLIDAGSHADNANRVVPTPSSSDCLFPSLSSMWLEMVDWETETVVDAVGNGRPAKKGLNNVARERARIGAPLSTVYVEHAWFKMVEVSEPGVRVVGVAKVGEQDEDKE